MKTVYWSFNHYKTHPYNFALGVCDIKPVLSQVPRFLVDDEKNMSYIKCPAFTDEIKNTFMLKAPFSFRVYKVNNGLEFEGLDLDVYTKILADNPIYGKMWHITLGFVFFSDSPLEMSQQHPFLHNKNSVSKWGNVLQGKYDIGKWFRSLNLAMIPHPNTTELSFSQGDILSYIKFHTDEKINFRQFEFTEKNAMYMQACLNHKKTKFHGIYPLSEVYSAFERNKFRKLILEEIKNNLID